MSVYPTGIDAFTTKVDNVNDVMAADVNGLQNSVISIETTLGLNPQGLYTDVAERLSFIPTTGGINLQVFTASDNFVVPSGVTKIKARMWGAGGGGAGGAAGDGVTNGNNGTDGTDSWVKVSTNKARAGAKGNAGTAAGIGGAASLALLPVLTAASFQSGSFQIAQDQPFLGTFQVFFQTFTALNVYSNGGNGVSAIPNAGLSGTGAYGGSDNITNFGANGNGGQFGEYAEWSISVTPGEIVPVTVGAGGTGGAASGGTNPGGAGGNGGSGLVIVEW